MSFSGTIEKLRHAHAVFAMLDTLCSEMGTLIDANAGTLGTSTNVIGNVDASKDLALRIEAVTVCVDYADFLEVTLPCMRRAVDDLVVVTSPTISGRGIFASARRPSRRHECDVSIRPASSRSGPRSTRGFAPPLSDWALVVDADIVLPRIPRNVEHLRLDPTKAVRSRPGSLPGLADVATDSDDASTGTRVGSQSFCVISRSVPESRSRPKSRGPIGAGYVPCGFFQLWNAGATDIRDYPADEAEPPRAPTCCSRVASRASNAN